MGDFFGVLLLGIGILVIVYMAARAISIAYFKTRSEYDRGEIGRRRKDGQQI